MSTELKTAMVAALSALAGTIAGGLISLYANQDLQDREFERSERQRLLQVRAVASVERDRLITAETVLRSVQESETLLRPPADLVEELTITERQALASAFRSRESRTYAEARTCVDALRRELRAGDEGDAINEFAKLRLDGLDGCLGDGRRVLEVAIRRSRPPD
jgi:hypothetical protein